MPLIVRVPRNNRVLRSHGPYRSALNVLDRKQTAVQRQLARGGLASYEPVTQATLLALAEVAPRPSVFFDIGAHIGLYSALIDMIFPEGSIDVRSFEPTPATAQVARRMALANGLTLLVEQLGMSSKPGTAQLFISAKAETSNSLTEGFRRSDETVDVEVTTIDAYCQQNRLAPAVIKIDVETFESHVLSGGLETFRTARPAIVCEILPANDDKDLRPVLDSLRDMGYTLYHVDREGGWAETAFGDYRRHVNHQNRDWLFVHGPLESGFEQARRRWLHAIAGCDETTNMVVSSASELPEGWNELYPRRAWTVGRVERGIRARLVRARSLQRRAWARLMPGR